MLGSAPFDGPPLAEFGADAARSFADETTGVGGRGGSSRRCRWRSGSRRSSAGYTGTGIPGTRDYSFGSHHDVAAGCILSVTRYSEVIKTRYHGKF